MPRPDDVRRKVASLGYRVRYVPHDVVGDHVACYHVVYQGRIVKPAAAKSLGIPLNEIWVSENYRDTAERVLYHELREIAYRASGWTPDKAHRQALVDEEAVFGPRPPTPDA